VWLNKAHIFFIFTEGLVKYHHRYGLMKKRLKGLDLIQAVLVGLMLFMAGMVGNVLSFYIARVIN
jgi:hypothetical protein